MTLYAYYTGSYRSPEEAIKNGADYYIDNLDESSGLFTTGNKLFYNTEAGELCTILNASQRSLDIVGMKDGVGYFFKVNDKPYPIEIEGEGVIPL